MRVDGSPAMLEFNRAQVADSNVTYVEADLFEWLPDRTYDYVCGRSSVRHHQGFWSPEDLRRRLRSLGWDVAINRVGASFMVGVGQRKRY